MTTEMFPSSSFDKSKAKSSGKAHALGIFIAFLREKGERNGQNEQLKAQFVEMLKDPDFEEYRDAIISEWVSMKYTAAITAAFPPNLAEIQRRRKQSRRDVKVRKHIIEDLKASIKARVMQMVMPNGKTLAKCSGPECIAMGGWLARVGEAVGPHRLVGEVFTWKQLAAMASQSRK